jgi:preprotein translocase subunit SecF
MIARIVALLALGAGTVTTWLLLIFGVVVCFNPDFGFAVTLLFGLILVEMLTWLVANDIDERRIEREQDSITD